MKRLILFVIMTMIATISMAQSTFEVLIINGNKTVVFGGYCGNGSTDPNDYQFNVVVKTNRYDTSSVFEYTFSNFDELDEYIIKLKEKLKEKLKYPSLYKIKITIIGLVNSCGENYSIGDCNFYYTVDRIIAPIKQFGDSDNKLYVDLGGNYIDKNGAKYNWNKNTHEFELANPDYYKPVEKIDISDL